MGISAPSHKDVLIQDSGYGRGYGYGYDGGYGVGGWVGAGVAFLVLIFIIWGVAHFAKGDGERVHDSVREHVGYSHGEAKDAAYWRGKNEARQEDLYRDIRKNGDRLERLEILTTRGFDAAICATKEGVKDLELYGDNVGFRAKEVVYPNPCAPRFERHEERECCERRDRDVRKTVTYAGALPQTVSISTNECA